MRFSVECAFPHLRKRRPVSRKSAFCTHRLTEKHILYPPRSQSAPFREDPQPECTFPWHAAHRVRFSVECAFPHLRKRRPASRKDAFCTHSLTEKRTLARRNRRTKACVPVVCLSRSGWSWAGGYADMPTRSWPDKQNRSTLTAPQGHGVRQVTGPRPSWPRSPHGRCRIRWRRVGHDPPSQTAAGT